MSPTSQSNPLLNRTLPSHVFLVDRVKGIAHFTTELFLPVAQPHFKLLHWNRKHLKDPGSHQARRVSGRKHGHVGKSWGPEWNMKRTRFSLRPCCSCHNTILKKKGHLSRGKSKACHCFNADVWVGCMLHGKIREPLPSLLNVTASYLPLHHLQSSEA